MLQGRAHEQEPRRAPARPGDTSGTDPPPSPSCCPSPSGDTSGTDPPPSPSCCPSSLHTTHGPTRPKGRGGSSYSHRTRAQPANSPRRQAAASRPHPQKEVHAAPGSSPRVRNAARPCPSRNRTSPLRATAPSPSRVAPARGIPMADSTRAHRGPPPAVVGQLADDGGGRRSPPGPCAHQARGLRFEGAAARAEPRSFSRSP
jgi:hypothetical protein